MKDKKRQKYRSDGLGLKYMEEVRGKIITSKTTGKEFTIVDFDNEKIYVNHIYGTAAGCIGIKYDDLDKLFECDENVTENVSKTVEDLQK